MPGDSELKRPQRPDIELDDRQESDGCKKRQKENAGEGQQERPLPFGGVERMQQVIEFVVDRAGDGLSRRVVFGFCHSLVVYSA